MGLDGYTTIFKYEGDLSICSVVQWMVGSDQANGLSPLWKRMLDDLARAIRYEIDKARGIIHGLVGEKKIVLQPTKNRAGNYFTAELAGDYAGLIPLIFQGKIKLVAVNRFKYHFAAPILVPLRHRTAVS